MLLEPQLNGDKRQLREVVSPNHKAQDKTKTVPFFLQSLNIINSLHKDSLPIEINISPSFRSLGMILDYNDYYTQQPRQASLVARQTGTLTVHSVCNFVFMVYIRVVIKGGGGGGGAPRESINPQGTYFVQASEGAPWESGPWFSGLGRL